MAGAVDRRLTDGAVNRPTCEPRTAPACRRGPGGVESSPDGTTFYAAAYDDMARPAVFSIDVASVSVAPCTRASLLLLGGSRDVV